MKKRMMQVAGVLMALTLPVLLIAQSTRGVVANRNTESDMASYKVYACLTKNCAVTDRNPALLRATIPQVPVGQTPRWSLPADTEGQVRMTAVDTSGNESGLSNAVNFDTLAPAIPQIALE